jgi:hypothetical protein
MIHPAISSVFRFGIICVLSMNMMAKIRLMIQSCGVSLKNIDTADKPINVTIGNIGTLCLTERFSAFFVKFGISFRINV